MMYLVLALCLLLAQCLLAGCLLTHEYPSAASALAPLRLPFTVSVCILHDNGDNPVAGKWANHLEQSLQTILPLYSPATANGDDNSDLKLSMRYSVIHSDSLLTAYATFISSMPQDTDGYHLFNIEQLAEFLHNELEGATGMHRPFPSLRSSLLSLPVLIVATDSLPRHTIYSQSPQQCTQSAVLSVAFLDLSARACDLRPHVREKAAHVRWNTPSFTHPWPNVFPIPDRQASLQTQQQPRAGPLDGPRAHFLYSRLAGVITSAVEALALGSLEWNAAQDSDRILCPIIILDANSNNTNHAAVNIPLITHWLRSLLLPNHQVTLVHSTHFVEENPQIAVALASAVKSHTSLLDGIARPYIDSARLLHELRTAGDDLCERLLSKSGNSAVELMAMERQARNPAADYYTGAADASKGSIDPFAAWDASLRDGDAAGEKMPGVGGSSEGVSEGVAASLAAGEKEAAHARRWQEQRELRKKLLKGSFKKTRRGSGVRVVPVFVLSGIHSHMRVLRNGEAEPVLPLLDGQSHTVVHDGVVLALHTDPAFLSSTSESNGAEAGASKFDINSGIATGLTEALTGLRPPHLQLLTNPNKHRKSVIDLTWTHGGHPFPPFSYLHSPPAHAPEAPAPPPVEPEYPHDSYGSFYESQYIYKEPPRPKYDYSEDAGVVSWAAKRSVLLARIRESVAMCRLTWQRGRVIVDKVQGILHMLQGSLSISAPAQQHQQQQAMDGKDVKDGKDGKDRPLHELGLFYMSDEQRNTMPVDTIRILTALQSDMSAIARELRFLIEGLGEDAEVHKVVSAMQAFDGMMINTDASLHSLEGELLDELADCRITFHGDTSMASHSHSHDYRRKRSGPVFSGVFILVPISGAVLLLFAVALLLLRVFRSLEKQSKKFD